MLINYIKIALRNISRQKGYSAINIFGLSLGLTCVIIISMVIRYELSFDGFHEKRDRIYRVYIEENRGNNVTAAAPVMMPFAPAAKNDIPDIENAVRVSFRTSLISFNDNSFYENTLFVDEDYFKVFSFPFIRGSNATALKDPNTVVITQNFAEKYFGKNDPVGKLLKFNNKILFKITGVIKNLPANSHLQGNIFASLNSFNESNMPNLNSWGSFSNDYTYLLLRKNADKSLFEKKLDNVIFSHTDEFKQGEINLRIQKLSSIHFSNLIYDNAVTTPVTFLYVFGFIAVFILLIACVNFINLTTARSMHRNKEVGIRKTVGANRIELIKQFLCESFLLTFISFIIAINITVLIIRDVNTILKQNISAGFLLEPSFIAAAAGILIFTALVSGAYPAFLLSRIRPAVVLKNSVFKKKNAYSLRAVLVVFQYAVSVFLIVGTFTVYKQTHYLLTRDLGFPSDKIIVLNNNDENIQSNGYSFKHALLQNNNIVSAAYSSGAPGSNTNRTSNFTPQGGSSKDEFAAQIIDVDLDFLNTYGLKLKAGRYFSEDFATDTSSAYILNETAAAKLGGRSAIGKRITIGDGGTDAEYCNVIGIIQDFNYSSLKDNISPVIFRFRPMGGRFLSLQLKETGITSTVDFIKRTYSTFSPSYPFEFFFIKESFEKYYRAESTIGKLLFIFSILAVIISCIGILGLVSFSTEQKSKEIGVRKVLGAPVQSIVIMLCKEFVKWVLIANILISPVTYIVMKSFLNDFAYRIDIGWMAFAGTLIISVAVTILTVSYHSLKAASANPVESLKYE
jgi:putative ABC transport system permease protein